MPSNFNPLRLPLAHHVIEYASKNEGKIVRICRCWKSVKFPFCDDSHKQLFEAGEAVGPYIARIQPYTTNENNQSFSNLKKTVAQTQVFTRQSLFWTSLMLITFSGLLGVQELDSFEIVENF